MQFKTILFLVFFLVITCSSFSQDKIPITFGSVSSQDFDISNLNVDTTSGAVIIADVGESSFEGNSKGWFTLIFKRKCRIKIINKNGFELADVQIPLYKQGRDGESVEKLKATTYNLEKGKVIEVKLGKDDIFEDREDRNHIVKKFTLPAIKEGSIIEYSYTIRSDYMFNFRSWIFQSTYPVAWSEYEARIPDFFKYLILSHGEQSFYERTQEDRISSYQVRLESKDPLALVGGILGGQRTSAAKDEIIDLKGKTTDYRWVMKDVPAFKKEKFITSLINYVSRIEFQLSGIAFPNQVPKDYMGTWTKASESLLKDEDFGLKLDKNNNWLNSDLKAILEGVKTAQEKAKKIYYYVKDNVKCTGNRGVWLDQSIKETFKNKSGTVSEVNMLLIAMLRHENLIANPVLLSTRQHGYTNEIYPLMAKFNYVVCQVVIDRSTYYLDATNSNIGFGKLPEFCYNGHARVINKEADPVYFLADTLSEIKYTTVILENDESGNKQWVGSYQNMQGYNESVTLREEIRSKGHATFENKIKSSYTNDFEISDFIVDDLNEYEKGIKINYWLTVQKDTLVNIIYFNPMLKEGLTENYFKSAERKCPIEMPYKIDENYSLRIDIPEGYEIDELPKSTKALLNEADGFFEYIVSKTSTSITLRSRLKLEKAFFQSEDYQTLRDFFDYVVKMHSQHFVFKKVTK